MNRASVLLVCGALSVLTACAAPFAIKRNILGAQRQASASVLTTGELSRRTHNVLYAWAYLSPDDPTLVPDRFPPRVRLACELYNRGLAQGLQQDGNVALVTATLPLPFGTLDVVVDPATLVWSGHQLHDFFPLTD